MAAEHNSSFDPDFAGPGEWAALYRQHGLQVVPARMPHPTKPWKMPALREWQHFQEELLPDAAFMRWYGPDGQFYRHRNVGVLTGRASDNLFVIDLDTHKNEGADLWWRGQLAINCYGQEPETWKQRTGGGGRQLLFRAPAGWLAPTNKTSQGVDIRGQGGFAMLPPSLHLSGKEYEWEPGCAPWDGVEVAMAAQWLLDAIDELVIQHGGHKPERDGGPAQRTESPASDFDAFHNRIDGREDAMRDQVWHAVLEFRRSGGTLGTEGEAQAFEAALHRYLRSTRTRLTGVDNVTGLERECRGPSAFEAKWRRATRKWGSDAFEHEAAKSNPNEQKTEPPPGEQPNNHERTAEDDFAAPPPGLIQTAEQFVAGFRPPDYLIKGILQRSYLYSLTARTGHGKTAVSMFSSYSIALGQPIRDRDVQQGAVLILAGENPDDIRARFLVLAEAFQFDPRNVPIHFLPGVVDIALQMHRIRAEAERIGPLAFVNVDTAAAYYKGDDANSNAQMGEYARLLRQLTTLPGKPAVVVNCHPVKNASRENLLPAGGGAFLNEVDGNLTLWSNSDGQTTLHWQGKFRGPEFEPINFALETRHADAVVDSNGEFLPSVIAHPLSDFQVEAGEQVEESEENKLLAAIGMKPGASVASYAKSLGFMSETGQPQKSKVFRLRQRLADDKLIERYRNDKWRVTAKGKKELGWNDE
jgi:hypothetical protein